MVTQVAIESQAAESVVIIRPSFKKICEGDSCRAALLNHILYWIARRHKQGVEYWYSTGEGLYHDLDETWGVTQVRRAVKALVKSNLVGEIKNPRMGIDRTKHFIFQAEQAVIFFAKCAAEKICYSCIGLAKDLMDLLNAHLMDLLNELPDREAIDETVKCLCSKHQGHLMELSKHLINLSHPFDGFIKAITQVSYSGTVIPHESVPEDSSLTSVSDRAYEKGYPDQTLLAQEVRDQYARITAMDEAFLAALQHELSPSYPQSEQRTGSLPGGHGATPGTGDTNHLTSTSAMADATTALQADVLESANIVSGKRTNVTQSALQAASTEELFPASIPVSQEAVKPASGNVTRRPRENNKAPEDIVPLPPPACPKDDAVWNVDTCLKLAAYYRGYSKLSERKQKRAKDAAISLIQRGKTREQVIKVYRYMLGLDRLEDGTGIYDEWWDGKEVDLWHVSEHCDVKLREIERKKNSKPKLPSAPIFVPPLTTAELRLIPV